MVGSWDAFDDPEWKWIRCRAALHQLIAIRQLMAIRDAFEYRLASDRPLTREEVDDVFDRLQATVKEMNDEWTTQRVEVIKANIRWAKR